MKLLFNKYNKKAIYIGIFFIIAFILIWLIFQRKARVSFSFMETSFFGGSATETQVQFDDGESYKIIGKEKRFSGENYLDYSCVNYPVIEFSNKTVNLKIGKIINQLLYETAMLNYDNDLDKEINAFYASDYSISLADQKLICIYYMQSIGSGMGKPANFENAVTISLETGERVSLEEFGSINKIMKKIKNYRGTIFLDDIYFTTEDWKAHKKEFIEEWMEQQDRCYYGYYLFEGRLGLLFDYYRTGRERIAFEFEDIIEGTRLVIG